MLRNFEEQARGQGGVFRRDATNQRGGTSDTDAEKEEGCEARLAASSLRAISY